MGARGNVDVSSDDVELDAVGASMRIDLLVRSVVVAGVVMMGVLEAEIVMIVAHMAVVLLAVAGVGL